MNENITLDEIICEYELHLEAHEAIDLPLYDEDEIDWASLSGLDELVIED